MLFEMKTLFYTLLGYYSFFAIAMIYVTLIKQNLLSDKDDDLIPYFFRRKRIECLIAITIAVISFYYLGLKADEVFSRSKAEMWDLSHLTLSSLTFFLGTIYALYVAFDVIISRKHSILERLTIPEEELEDLEEEP